MVSKMRETLVEGERMRYRASDNLLERFDKAIKKDDIYENRSVAIRALILQYIEKVESAN